MANRVIVRRVGSERLRHFVDPGPGRVKPMTPGERAYFAVNDLPEQPTNTIRFVWADDDDNAMMHFYDAPPREMMYILHQQLITESDRNGDPVYICVDDSDWESAKEAIVECMLGHAPFQIVREADQTQDGVLSPRTRGASGSGFFADHTDGVDNDYWEPENLRQWLALQIGYCRLWQQESIRGPSILFDLLVMGNVMLYSVWVVPSAIEWLQVLLS